MRTGLFNFLGNIGGAEPYWVAYGSGTDVHLYDSSDDSDIILPFSLTRLDAIEIDIPANRVFLSSHDSGGYPDLQIYQLDGTKLYSAGGWSFRLAIDRSNQHIFECDVINGIDDIIRRDYDGNSPTVVMSWSTNVHYIAVDPLIEMSFGISENTNLYSSPYNSSTKTTVTTMNSTRRFGVRPSEGRVYYCADNTSSIHSIKYDGSGMVDTGIVCDNQSHVYVDEYENVYFTLNGDAYVLKSSGIVELFWPGIGVTKLSVQMQ